MRLREQLGQEGMDAGAESIRWHLEHRHAVVVSRATVHRVLSRRGLVTADPTKRPKVSYRRFEAAMPNECWQSDFTHYRLADGTDCEIITWLDDCSRYALHITAHRRITTPLVVDTFTTTCALYGKPASSLTDNGRSTPPDSAATPAATDSKHSWHHGAFANSAAEAAIPKPKAKSSGSSKH